MMSMKVLVSVFFVLLSLQGERVPVPQGQVAVQVVDPEGQPLRGVEVLARTTESERREIVLLKLRPARGGSWKSVGETDAEGFVRFEALGAKEHRVTAGDVPHWAYAHTEPFAVERGGTEVVLQLEELPDARLISGTVSVPPGESLEPSTVHFVWNDRGLRKAVSSKTNEDGSFLVLADQDDVTGALWVQSKDLQPVVLESIRCGSSEVRLELQKPRLFEIEARGLQGRIVDRVQVYVQRLAHDLRLFTEDNGRELDKKHWRLPNVRFQVSMFHRDYERESFGPFDPEEIGSKLTLQLKPRPRLRGRVTKNGIPVAASLSSRPLRSSEIVDPLNLDEDRGWFSTLGPHYNQRTDPDGTFDFPVFSEGPVELWAWSEGNGQGKLAPIELGEGGAEGLEIELTVEPGEIRGRVLLPVGHDPSEIWLITDSKRGCLPLQPDGSYALTNMQPGPCWIGFVAAFGTTSWMPVSTTISKNADSEFIQFSHGPSGPPEWLRPDQGFTVHVEPGKTVEKDLDLASEPPFRLSGRVSFDGLSDLKLVGGVFLDKGDSRHKASRVALGEDGTFSTGVWEPGAYRLKIHAGIAGTNGSGERGGKASWTIIDRVELHVSQSHWNAEFRTGSLLAKPEILKGWKAPASFYGKIHWRGEGELRVVVGPGTEKDNGEDRFFPLVPVGRVRIFSRAGDPDVPDLRVIQAGETLEYDPMENAE